ncbi:Ribosome-releasing factor 2 [Blattella germanica]|nr:Ribosome-releasing factor 2 [Blattella germanica]
MAYRCTTRYATLFRWSFSKYRQYSQKYKIKEKEPVSHIRNIGLLAHIDAGKTTTTERMLFYAGTINSMGEVHHGNTVTDYMEEERLRGITISSVAVTFSWNKHRFNLIDTPGHIDFTMEVEQTLGVLDGVVILLDGSAGVEAQTLTVWRQAERYNLPCVIYVNKMDRSDADFALCLENINSKLGVRPLPIHLPIHKNGLKGIIDLINLEKLIWSQKSQGQSYERTKLSTDESNELTNEAMCSRNKLIDILADVDDELAEVMIQEESTEKISPALLKQSLRKTTLQRLGVPVICGSSYKNVGVQTLMDAVIDFLPAPDERNQELSHSFGSDLCARAFKVVHDRQRGPITFFRLFSGKFTKGQKIYNIPQCKSENSGKLMVSFADETEEVDEVSSGNIAAMSGLKFTMPGDLITSNSGIAKAAIKNLEKFEGNTFVMRTRIPDPVFFCSIEPPSKAYQQALDQALQELEREDPSLRVSQDGETGQTVLGGMGELHLEIIKNRILSDYRIEADLGELQIAYKETIESSAKDTHVTQHKIGSGHHNVTATLSVLPNKNEKDILVLDRSPDNAANIAAISQKHLNAVKLGLEAAMIHGPKLGCPVVDVQVMLHWLEVGRGTSETIISASITQCIRKLLEAAGIHLLEPVMNLEVVTNDEYLSVVLADLSRRRAQIKDINTRGPSKILTVVAPLVELLGYSTDLRTITSGTATFTMEFLCYQPMAPQDEAKAIRNITGF